MQFISQLLYVKHSIICPAVHTVAKRMRLIVSGLMKLSSSFTFRAQISAFQSAKNRPFQDFSICQKLLSLPRHDLQGKPKSPNPPFAISFA